MRTGMTIAELADLPEVGVGILHTPELAQRLGDRLLDIAVEVDPCTCWRPLGDDAFAVPDDELFALRSYVGGMLVHGGGDPVGGTVAASAGVVDAFARSIDALRPPWVSERLAFNRYAVGESVHTTGITLPQLQCEEAVGVAVSRLRELASRVRRPVAFETSSSYLRVQPWELPDGDVIAAVAEEADCGIVLDLHAVYANALNNRQPLDELIAALPLARVIEVHLAGGRSHGGYWLDAHCGTTPFELRALAELVIPRLPNLKAIVFELVGRYGDRIDELALTDEIAWLQWLWSVRGHEAGIGVRRRRTPTPRRDVPPPEVWESTLGELVRGRVPGGTLARTLAADPGVAIYRELLSRRRRSAITDALPWTLGALRLCAGPEHARATIDRLLHETSPALIEPSEALRFAAALGELPLDPLVRDTLSLERASLRARHEGVAHRVQIEHDPSELFAALADGTRPPRIATFEVELSP